MWFQTNCQQTSSAMFGGAKLMTHVDGASPQSKGGLNRTSFFSPISWPWFKQNMIKFITGKIQRKGQWIPSLCGGVAVCSWMFFLSGLLGVVMLSLVEISHTVPQKGVVKRPCLKWTKCCNRCCRNCANYFWPMLSSNPICPAFCCE